MIERPHLDYCHTWEKLLFWGTGAGGAPMGGRGMRPRGAKRPLSACRECSATQQVGRPGSWAAASSSPVPASAARFHATVSVVCWCMNCKNGTTNFLTWEDSFLGSKGPYMMSTDEKAYFCLKMLEHTMPEYSLTCRDGSPRPPLALHSQRFSSCREAEISHPVASAQERIQLQALHPNTVGHELPK